MELERRLRPIQLHITNASWMLLDNAFQMILAAVISILLARMLGPSAVGAWSYAFAIYTISVSIAALGTDQIAIVDFVTKDRSDATILVTALVARGVASTIISFLVFGFALARAIDEPQLAFLLGIMAFAIPATAFDVIETWFRANAQFRLPAIANSLAGAVGAAAKILIIIGTGSLPLMGGAHFLQVASLEVIMLTFLLSTGFRIHWSDFNSAYLAKLLRDSSPILAGTIATLIYTRSNIFILEHLRGTADVGLYSAATRVSELFYLVPTIAVSVLRPVMYRYYNEDSAQFVRRFDQILSVAMLTLVPLCVFIATFAKPILMILFGNQFEASVPVLMIHVWTVLFAAQGLISGIWFMAARLTYVFMLRSAVGAVFNIVLGFMLIPEFGSVGAASATLLSMMLSGMLVHLLCGRTARRIFVHQLRSFILLGLFPTKIAPSGG
jgi:PST family polysaccharide transporter